MVTSIRELCKRDNYRLEDTIYGNSPEEMLDFQIVCGDFYKWENGEGGKKQLVYKDSPVITDFAFLEKMIPEFGDVSYSIRDEMPYFISELDKIADAMARGERIGVEGGPCLFGTDEVTVEIKENDGTTTYFDYNTGKTYLEGTLSDGVDFAEFVEQHAVSIKTIHFEKKKPDLTPQEWAFIKYPFEIARALSAELVIPLPDMSYVKYLDSILRFLPDNIHHSALEEFRAVAYEISDMYLAVIEKMKKIYNSIPCKVLHERDEELCRQFYEARAPFIERNRVIRKLTKYQERVEPVKDYVSMPALPYYFFGSTGCVEVDSMDETDSHRKCQFAHKGAGVDFACILYPELLSKDGVHTIFEAPTQMKEYGEYDVC